MRNALAAILVLGVSTALALALAEWVAGRANRDPAAALAAREGLPWDARDRLEVVEAQRRADPDWFPAVPANTYLERPLRVEGTRTIPLGGVARAQVVGCNENGYFSTWRTDEYGFPNPPGALDSPGRAIAFVGDSFTQGDCLHQEESIVGRVRAGRAETVVNLGSGGNGPLFELAGIREYVRPAGVSHVFWMYYEGNDLDDLRRDRAEPMLAAYLDPGTSQDLRRRQAAINRAVRDMVDARYEERLRGRARILPNLRLLVWRAREGAAREASPAPARAPGTPAAKPRDDLLATFLETLRVARDEVGAKGGRLVFVYLPEYARYAGPKPSATAARRDEVLAGVRALGIPTVDVDEAFRRQPDPVGLFPFGLKGHYNARGAEVAAREILGYLERAR